MFDESKHPRDERGRFTDGSSRRYAQNMSYGEIMREDREKEKSHFTDTTSYIALLKYAGYNTTGMTEEWAESFAKDLNLEHSAGALHGAYTNKNDPENKKREAAANAYYLEILNRKREYEIAAVANNSGMKQSEIEKVFSHVFEQEHLFENGKIHKFIPDYDMAQSWFRLREGKKIYPHDMILLKHELMEANIMKGRLDIVYDPVHRLVEKKYNYALALAEYKTKYNLW